MNIFKFFFIFMFAFIKLQSCTSYYTLCIVSQNVKNKEWIKQRFDVSITGSHFEYAGMSRV